MIYLVINLTGWRYQGQSNVTLNFLNGMLYFSLHILVAHFENFPRHYNKIFVHEITFRVTRLENYSTADISTMQDV